MPVKTKIVLVTLLKRFNFSKSDITICIKFWLNAPNRCAKFYVNYGSGIRKQTLIVDIKILISVNFDNYELHLGRVYFADEELYLHGFLCKS